MAAVHDHITRYHFHPGDEVWHRDQVHLGYKKGTIYQVEIKLFTQQDASIGKKLTYVVAIEGYPITKRVQENELYYKTEEEFDEDGNKIGGGKLVTPGDHQRYPAIYDYSPGEEVWVINRKHNAVKHGKVYQTEIKIHRDDGDPEVHSKILYYVRYNDRTGTKIAKSDEVFDTNVAAWAALDIVLGPPPTPTVPPTDPPVPGTSAVATVSKRNGENTAMYKGTPVSIDQATGSVVFASSTNARAFLGFVYDEVIPSGHTGRIVTEGTMETREDRWKDVTVEAGVLGIGKLYYLADALGKITTICPQPEEGKVKYAKQVGIAATDTELDIRNGLAIRL